MKREELELACPGVNLTKAYHESNESFTVADYIIKHLPKTLQIINSSPHLENSIIVAFVKSGIQDHRLPYKKEFLIENLACTCATADNFLVAQSAQSAFFAVKFNPLEFKELLPWEAVPFVTNSRARVRAGGFGMVEMVFEDGQAFARETLKARFDMSQARMKIEILKLATETGNPHILKFRCGYKQDDRICLVTYPWCELDLGKFLADPLSMPFWTKLDSNSRVLLVTDWMACLASGLSALHKKQIKHQDLKPENVLLTSDLKPVICDFGLSKVFEDNSKATNVHGTPQYMPPEEQEHGKVGRKGDIFSLGLIFFELGLIISGKRAGLRSVVKSTRFNSITEDLETYLSSCFPSRGNPTADEWIARYRGLIAKMLNKSPEDRPNASKVWQELKEMIVFLKGEPHCDQVSPVGSIPAVDEEDKEDREIQVMNDDLQMLDL